MYRGEEYSTSINLDLVKQVMGDQSIIRNSPFVIEIVKSTMDHAIVKISLGKNDYMITNEMDYLGDWIEHTVLWLDSDMTNVLS